MDLGGNCLAKNYLARQIVKHENMRDERYAD